MSSEDLGESSNKAFCLLNDGEALVKPASVSFRCLAFCEIVRRGLGKACWTMLLDDLVSSSGEKEGNEVRAGSSSSSIDFDECLEPCRLGAARRVFGCFFCSAELWEV